jgi:hypothetical protein
MVNTIYRVRIRYKLPDLLSVVDISLNPTLRFPSVSPVIAHVSPKHRPNRAKRRTRCIHTLLHSTLSPRMAVFQHPSWAVVHTTAARSGSDHSRQKRWLPSPRAWRQAIPFTCGGATRLPLHHHLGGGCGSSHPSLFRSNRSRCERLCQARPRLLRSQGTYISFQSRWQFQYKISHLLLKYKIDVVVFYPNWSVMISSFSEASHDLIKTLISLGSFGLYASMLI